jgi:hypothetical protein
MLQFTGVSQRPGMSPEAGVWLLGREWLLGRAEVRRARRPDGASDRLALDEVVNLENFWLA